MSSDTAPFVGLRPFDKSDHRWFKGRSRETAALAQKVRGNRFTAVVGASGSGKSSLVRAGILPGLEEDGWVAIITKPGSAPIEKLAGALGTIASGEPEDPLAEARRYRFSIQLRSCAFGLAELERNIAPDAPRLLLIIDQFEELFRFGEEAQGTQKAAMQEESRAFVELLLTASVQPESRLHIVITMRSDFFGNCAAYAGLAEAISESQYLVPLPRRDDLERAIRGPLEDVGSSIDDALVQRLLIDMEEQVDRLPTLQHTLRRLWEEAKGTPKHLSDNDYKTIGGMAGSIHRKAEQVREGLEKANPSDGDTLEWLMKAITTLDDQGRASRRPQTRSKLRELLDEGLPNNNEMEKSLDRVIAALAKEEISFLTLGEGADPEIEVGHEALIRSWCRLCGDNRDFRSGWLFQERADGRRWRELAGRAEQKLPLSFMDWKRTRTWMRRRRIGKIWCARYGDAWDDANGLLRYSFGKSSLVGLFVTSVAVVVLAFFNHSNNEQIDKTKRFAAASATAKAGYAKMLARDGNTRQAALVALEAVPDNEANNARVEAALAHALSLPIERLKLAGPEKPVFDVAFSPDGKRIVSAFGDGSLRLWDTATGEPVGQPLLGHNGTVRSVAFSQDGQHIVSGFLDGTLQLGDATTGVPIGQPLSGHKGPVVSVAFSPDRSRIISASLDGTLRLWNADNGVPVGKLLDKHTGSVRSVAFSPDGKRIVSASSDKSLILWDSTPRGVSFRKRLEGHLGVVYSVAFSPDGTRIVSGSSDNTLRVWDAVSGNSLVRSRGHVGAVFGVAFSPDGKRILSGSLDGTLRVWNTATGAALGPPLRGDQGEVYIVAFSPDGKRFASASADHTVRLWDAAWVESAAKPLVGFDPAIPSTSFAISPAGQGKQRIISGFADGTLKLWDGTTGDLIGKPWQGHEREVSAINFSPDEQVIASGSSDGTLLLWDAATGNPSGKPIRVGDSAVTAIAFSPDQSRLALGYGNSTIRIWNKSTGTAFSPFAKEHTGKLMALAFSPDGKHLVSGSLGSSSSDSSDNTLRLWDMDTGRGRSLVGHKGPVNSVAFSHNGKKIVSGSSDGALMLWDTDHPENSGIALRGHAGAVRSIVFSPDDRRIVSASRDNTIRVWDVATGIPIGLPLFGHDQAVIRVAFMSNGRHILSASDDKTLRTWDIGRLLASQDELVKDAGSLCPLSQPERQELALSEPNSDPDQKSFTDVQRLACGKNVR